MRTSASKGTVALPARDVLFQLRVSLPSSLFLKVLNQFFRNVSAKRLAVFGLTQEFGDAVQLEGLGLLKHWGDS